MNIVNFLTEKLSGNAFCNKLRCSNLALMSFAAFSSLLSDMAINQNSGNFLKFQSNMKQKY